MLSRAAALPGTSAEPGPPPPEHRFLNQRRRLQRLRPTLAKLIGTVAVLALPSMAVVAAEAAPLSGRADRGAANSHLYAELQRMAATVPTLSDDSDTNFTAHRAAMLLRERQARFGAFLAAAQRAQSAAQAEFYRGLYKLAHRPYALPDSGVLTQGYGGAGGHPGIDIAGPYGSPILAAARGVVVFAGQEAGYGNFIEIQQADGTFAAYGHLSSIGVSVGQRVIAGQQIGAEGSTGESTGPHLHFEIRRGRNGPTEDPLAWLNARGISVAGQG